MSLKGKTAIVGVGELKATKVVAGKTTVGLMAQASKMAIEDAGLRKEDIDGIICEPRSGEDLSGFPSLMAQHLQIYPRFASTVGTMGATYAGMVWRASAAIVSGMATNVLCVAGANQNPITFTQRRVEGPVRGGAETVYGTMGAPSGYALIAQRHAYEFGTTDEQRAKVAVDQRFNALANPKAFFYGQPITLKDVLNSRMVSDPLRILECVMPVSGAEAVVVTTAERARSLRQPPAYILGAGECATHSSLLHHPRMTHSGVKVAASQAFAMAGVSPKDINVTEIYDCFTITVLITLEDAGFCPKGESGPFCAETDMTYKGKLPVNTHGGQLSFGQPGGGGMTQVVEGALQVMGRAEGRQVPNCELAYINGNGGIMSTQCSLIFGRQI